MKLHSIITLGLLTLSGFLVQAADRWQGEPNSKLPAHVKPVKGKLTLFADYKKKDEKGQIPVYFINTTDKKIKLDAQDGDVYLKLETKSADGKWKRVQPHAYSW